MANSEMFAALLQRLKDDCLNCTICTDDFKDPIILPCHHSFCRKCLGDSVRGKIINNKFQCQVCDKLTEIPVDGVQGFPVDERVANMLTKIDALLKVVPCSSCDTKENARWNCKTCRQAYCNRCIELHKNIQDAEKHQTELINAEDVGEADPEMTDSFYREARLTHYCPKHKKEELDLYCKDDNLVVCGKCIAVKHRDHEIIDAEDRATEIRNDISDVLKKGESNFKRPLVDYIDFIENTMVECRANHDETAISIHAYFQKIQAEIDAKKADCLQNLKNNYAYQVELLETISNDMSGRLGRYNNERRLLEILKSDTSDVQLIKMRDKLKDTFTAWESNDWQRPYKSITFQINVFANDKQTFEQYLDSVSLDVEDQNNDIAGVDNAAKVVVVIDQTGKEKMRLDQLDYPCDVVFNINGDVVAYFMGDRELKVYSDTGVLKHKTWHNRTLHSYEKYVQTAMYGHILAKTSGNKNIL
ncbi:unnamed protein product [Owenia fusiformis]|uniref:Uncharacterized protein n=1 Tax=Owenia fusiformis TaxID=6347 RepID=A0A8J1XY70_OWEFU|nr:unnamed protein product [Owenia fusiformis]